MKFKTFASAEHEPALMYKLMTQTIVPRPIAWVSTLNDSGSVNLAPYSFFNALTSRPPMLMVSIARRPNGGLKDTHINIARSKEFVVNTVTSGDFDSMVGSAATYEYGVSEVEKVGLSLLASENIKTPRIAETAVQFECVLHQAIDLGEDGDISATVVFGKILKIHIRADLIGDDNRMSTEKLNPLGRLGGISYSSLGTVQTKTIPEPK